ncbi:hypothetical protein QJS04_geneDACA003974 [Acorus gramineus]|uniref:Uncharacterized protein n=1 Tax=Acorus gramineus TaxID=55184 RepID=A0AAV9BH52_ACOGR|nr:hypothetical protein QJS04_geneDACA003974 [Acorus gramineus]
MDLGDLNKVWEIKALKKPGEDEARRFLEKVAKQVQPIMRRRKWRVKKLSEFSPSNPALLGLNVGGGIEVKLRLRRPNREWDFFPYEQVLDTMLHELCHNVHGPHNASFYKLWDELRKECEELVSKGISGTGQGFDAPGRRLGGFLHQPPLSSLQKSALAAAEKRARAGALLPSGPKRLGGDSDIMTALSPIQAAAMAAERRMQDDLWCASQSCSGSSASHDDTGFSDVSDGSTSFGNDISNVLPQKRSRASSLSHSDEKSRNVGIVDLTDDGTESNREDRPEGSSTCGASVNNFATGTAEKQAIWQCNVCTLINQALAPICEACGTQKPRSVDSKFKIWSCKFCTLENSVNLDRCSACDQWKYSLGAPVSTRGPNLGT